MTYPYDPWWERDVPLLDDYTDLELGYDTPIPEPVHHLPPTNTEPEPDTKDRT